jgi:cytochrome P450 family 142 subfamily A polypeptide 1
MPGVEPARPWLLDRDLYAGDPEPSYAWLREHAPCYRDERAGLWALSRHADVLFASRRTDLFCSGRGYRPNTPNDGSMIGQDAPRHTRQRLLVSRGFTPRRVAAFEPKVRQLTNRLLDAVCERGECDFVHDLAAPLPMALISDMLGIAPEDRDRLQALSDAILDGADGLENVTPAVNAAAAELFGHFAKLVEERRRAPRDDLVSLLAHAELDGERMGEGDVLSESVLILVGGNETTRNVLSGAMLALIENPGEREKLLADPAGLPRAVEEFVRWVSPIQNFRRTATRALELHGERIAEGDQVLLIHAAANRDPRAFSEPERFDVGRDPNPHLAFGHGTHFCLGANLARLEVRVFYEELLRRIPRMERKQSGPVPRTRSSFIRGIPSLPVVFPPSALEA